jgi:epoxyqueuosine reductase QueG
MKLSVRTRPKLTAKAQESQGRIQEFAAASAGGIGVFGHHALFGAVFFGG